MMKSSIVRLILATVIPLVALPALARAEDGVRSTAVSSDAHFVFVRRNDGKLYRQEAITGEGRTAVGGSAAHPVISYQVSPDNSVYFLDTSGALFRYMPGSGNAYIDGGVQQIASTGDGTVYDLNADGALYRYIPGWGRAYIDGGVQQITPGEGTIYDLNFSGALYRYTPGSGLGYIDGGVQQIASTGDGTVYDLNFSGALYRYTPGSGLGYIDGGVKQMAAGNGAVYDLNVDGALYVYIPGRGRIYIDGGVQQIASTGDGTVYDLNADGALYRYIPGWGRAYIDGGVQQITAGEGTIYDLNFSGALYRYTPGSGLGYIESGVKAIAGINGPWVFEHREDGQLLLRCADGTSRQLEENVLAIAPAPDGVLYALRKDKTLFMFSGAGTSVIAWNVQGLVQGTDEHGRPQWYIIHTNGTLFEIIGDTEQSVLASNIVALINGTDSSGKPSAFILQIDGSVSRLTGNRVQLMSGGEREAVLKIVAEARAATVYPDPEGNCPSGMHPATHEWTTHEFGWSVKAGIEVTKPGRTDTWREVVCLPNDPGCNGSGQPGGSRGNQGGGSTGGSGSNGRGAAHGPGGFSPEW